MVLEVDRPETAAAAAAVLSRGGVAVLPTDTIYGFSGIVPDTEERIRSLKGRGEDKPFLMLIGDPDWITAWSDFTVPETLSRFWPGPLTLILPGRRGEKHAFRRPDQPFLAAILAELGRPIYSTSVNRAGEPFLWNIDEIIKRYASTVDCIVTAGDRPGGAPSTVLDLSVRPFHVVRQGKIVIPPATLR